MRPGVPSLHRTPRPRAVPPKIPEPSLGWIEMQDTGAGASSVAVCRSCQHMDARFRLAAAPGADIGEAACPSSRPTLSTTIPCQAHELINRPKAQFKGTRV